MDPQAVTDAGSDIKTIRGYSKSKAAKDKLLTRVAYADFVIAKDGTVVEYTYTPES